ncbi:hypothetical protein HanIR_Chr01g0012261 [Helianthus annuus]|nr:hypothetical protein HanIR_Chr01g0012261 [Helianthus annuus]
MIGEVFLGSNDDVLAPAEFICVVLIPAIFDYGGRFQVVGGRQMVIVGGDVREEGERETRVWVVISLGKMESVLEMTDIPLCDLHVTCM